MSLVATKDYTDANQMLADYAARRARIFGRNSNVVTIKPLSDKPVRAEHRRGLLWTEKESNQLRQMVDEGMTAQECADALGRSIGGVYDYANKMGFSFRRTPQQRVAEMVAFAPDCRLIYEIPPNEMQRAQKVRLILKQVAEDLGVTVGDILGQSRVFRIVRARQQAMWLCARDTDQSISGIGRIFDRDHTTVIHAVRVENARLGKDVRGLGTSKRGRQ